VDPKLLDNPLVLAILFHPRTEELGRSRLQNVHDGTIPIPDEAVLGYRLYVNKPESPVILYFHGNAEVASDYDDIAPTYHRVGASLLVVDYRGYGWSTGRPLVSTLLSDVGPVREALPGILEGAGIGDVPLLVMGRSLGSACAIHMVHLYPDQFRGLIIESGFAHTLPLLARLGVPADALADLPDPIGNVQKMGSIALPLLVIHGERDMLIPVANGQALYDASPARLKYIVRVMRAGHNDLLYYGAGEYFAAIKGFLDEMAA
jgi:pimeloyl-ACP methyl ester carboxylesterase